MDRPDPNRKDAPSAAAIRNAYKSGREIKRPGDANWISVDSSREAGQVMAVKCPNSGVKATAVDP